jgi:SAM-dependent methyltransferase
MPVLSKEDLQEVSARTIRHYDESAQSFWEGTKDHDVTQNYEALLGALPKGRPLKILDFGCGPGRDVAHFKKLGHEPTGLDGSPVFCRMTEAATGCPTLNQDFLRLDLPRGAFDGVFANASLFHVPRQELVRVLKELKAALVPRGILFSSNPRGSAEGWNGPRYGNYLELEPYAAMLAEAGFKVLHHYYRPAGLPCAQQPWLAVVSQSV